MFSLNLLDSVTKIFVITVKGLEPATPCARDQDPTTAPARHVWKTGSLNWPWFVLQWFIRFLEFTEFSFHFGKTPMNRVHIFCTKGTPHETFSPKITLLSIFSITLQTLLNVSKCSTGIKNNYALHKIMSHEETKKTDTAKTGILTRKIDSMRKFDRTSCPDKAKISRREAFHFSGSLKEIWLFPFLSFFTMVQ